MHDETAKQLAQKKLELRRMRMDLHHPGANLSIDRACEWLQTAIEELTVDFNVQRGA